MTPVPPWSSDNYNPLTICKSQIYKNQFTAKIRYQAKNMTEKRKYWTFDLNKEF